MSDKQVQLKWDETEIESRSQHRPGLMTFARVWNTLMTESNAMAIGDIMDKGIIDESIKDSTEWSALLKAEPNIICALDSTDPVYGHRYYDVDLPDGWGWSASDGIVTLKDADGKPRYTKSYRGLSFQ